MLQTLPQWFLYRLRYTGGMVCHGRVYKFHWPNLNSHGHLQRQRHLLVSNTLDDHNIHLRLSLYWPLGQVCNPPARLEIRARRNRQPDAMSVLT